jgi:L-asparaginase/beta-aspartyl-peptidase (threonine type)
MIKYGIVVHGGAGSPGHFTDGCKKACKAAFRMLETGENSLDAVVEAVRILEDDGRFNAGTGSALRLDGKTIEMDAAVMNSDGKVGIVIAIKRIKNPIRAARAVLKIPHVALAGDGATVFARQQGLRTFRKPSKSALERYEKVKQEIQKKRLGEEIPQWQGYDIESLWNFKDESYNDAFCDTVGAVAIDVRGVLSVATSTGGFSPMMQGRVGDSAMIGCGFYAGPACAIASTGIGEEIIKKMLAKTVYDTVSQGEDIKRACEKGMSMFPSETKVGMICISKEGFVALSNTGMAHYSLIEEA